MMKDNKFKYGKLHFLKDVSVLCILNFLNLGWTLSLTEYMETIPTLWKTTKDFMEKNKELVNWGPDSLMPWITDNSYETYNGCHFWSNFEVH